VIAAGLRVAVVSNVSIVTMAALLGIPQLGSLFTQGSSYASSFHWSPASCCAWCLPSSLTA